MKTAPTIGRVVWYKDTVQSDQMLSASVAYVHNEDCVNLSVSDQSGNVSGRTSVTFHHGDADACPENQCCWMPYQKAQAEKHAQEAEATA